MSTTILEVQEDTSDLELPLGRDTTSSIRFLYANGHYRWATVHLMLFKKQFYKSRIKSIACCQGASQKKFDGVIDRIHTRRFGVGKWLKLEREELPLLSAQDNTCQQREIDALQRLGVDCGGEQSRDDHEDEDDLPFGDQHRLLQKRLFDLPSYQPQTENKRKKRRIGYFEDASEFGDEADAIERSLRDLANSAIDGNQKRAVEETISQRTGAVSTSAFVRIVLAAITHLREEESAKQDDTTSLVKLFNHRTTRLRGDDDRLEKTLDDGTKLLLNLRADAGMKQEKEKFEFGLLASNVKVLRRFLLGQSDRTRNGSTTATDNLSSNLIKLLGSSLARMSSKETSEKKRHSVRQMDLRESKMHTFFNRVVDGLYQIAGPSALGLYAVMEATGGKLGDLRRVRDEDMAQYVSSAVEALKSSLSRIPDFTKVLHVPAILSWFLDIEYADVCHGLHLSHFAQDNPGMASKLDDLMDKFNSLDSMASDYPCQVELLNRQVRAALRLPMSQLRSTVGHASGDILPSRSNDDANADQEKTKIQNSEQQSRSNYRSPVLPSSGSGPSDAVTPLPTDPTMALQRDAGVHPRSTMSLQLPGEPNLIVNSFGQLPDRSGNQVASEMTRFLPSEMRAQVDESPSLDSTCSDAVHPINTGGSGLGLGSHQQVVTSASQSCSESVVDFRTNHPVSPPFLIRRLGFPEQESSGPAMESHMGAITKMLDSGQHSQEVWGMDDDTFENLLNDMDMLPSTSQDNSWSGTTINQIINSTGY